MLRKIFILVFLSILCFNFANAQLKLKDLNKIAKALNRLGGEPAIDQYNCCDNNQRVIGLEPSFLISETNMDAKTGHKYYNLLTDLVVGEYDINPKTGAPMDRGALRRHLEVQSGKKTIIEHAINDNPNINILLYIGIFEQTGNYEDIKSFFQNHQNQQEKLIDSLNTIIDFWEKEIGLPKDKLGFYIDFTDLQINTDPAYRNLESLNPDIKNFVAKIKNTYSNPDADPITIMFGLASYYPDRFNFFIKQSNEIVDLYVLKAYLPAKFVEPGFPITLPTRLFDDSYFSLDEHVMKNGYRAILEGDFPSFREKVIIEYPFYNTYYFNDNGLKKRNDRSPYNSLGNTNEKEYENETSDYVLFQDVGKDYHYFADDSTTLDKKMKYIRGRGFKGLSVWGMGFNSHSDLNKRESLWHAIKTNVGVPPPRLGWLGAGMIFLLGFMGVPYTIFTSWEVRNILAKYKKYLFNVSLTSFIFLVLFFVCIDERLQGTAAFYIAMALAGIYMLSKILRKYMRHVKKYGKYIGLKI